MHELLLMQKDLKERVAAQERFIDRFQLLVRSDGLFSQVIDNLPYPVAIFRQDGALCMANRTLLQQAGIGAEDFKTGNINLLDRITNENYALLEAIEDVFLGETTMLEHLVAPLLLFRRDGCVVPDAYHGAVLFPLRDGMDSISHGAIMLM